MSKRVVYQPPSRKIIDDYARHVCERLAETYGSGFTKPEVIWGFAQFIEFTATVWAKHLSEQEQSDAKLDKNDGQA